MPGFNDLFNFKPSVIFGDNKPYNDNCWGTNPPKSQAGAVYESVKSAGKVLTDKMSELYKAKQAEIVKEMTKPKCW